MEFIPITRWRS